MDRKLAQTLGSIGATLVVMGVLAALVWFVALPWVRELPFFAHFTESRVVVSFHEYHALPEGVAIVVMDGEQHVVTPAPIVESIMGQTQVYMPVGFLREHLDPFLFFDVQANTFFATGRYAMAEFVPWSANFSVNGQPRRLMDPIRLVDDEIFLPIDVISGLYPFEVLFDATLSIIVFTSHGYHNFAAAGENSPVMRFRPDAGAPIAIDLVPGEQLMILDDHNGFVRARAGNGLLGYVASADIGASAPTAVMPAQEPLLGEWLQNFICHPPQHWPDGQFVNMVWENTQTFGENDIRMQNPPHESVNVLSPVWFRIDPAGTHINSIVSQAYINWARARGIAVWPLVFDVDPATADAFFTNSQARRHVVAQLVSYVDTFGLDGLNIDFEHLAYSHGPYKIQFLRELAIALRSRGVVLSAAVKVPIPATEFYRRDLIGLTVDFVMLMAYDEHWSTSPVEGPVASLPWVSRAIENTLAQVSHNKLVLGLPFYNTMWRIRHSDGQVSTRQVGIGGGRAFFEENGVQWEWDPYIASYFGEFSAIEDGETVFWRIWLEDARSIQAKMQLVSSFNLAGVAGWQRGLETPEIWSVIEPFTRN